MAVYHDVGGKAGGRRWPGLEVRPGGLEMDPEALVVAAEQLRKVLKSVGDESAGALRQMAGATAQPAGTSFFGGWDVARDVAEGYRVAQEAFVECYLRLVDQLNKTVDLLSETAGETERVDRHGAAVMDRQQAQLGASGSPVEVREA